MAQPTNPGLGPVTHPLLKVICSNQMPALIEIMSHLNGFDFLSLQATCRRLRHDLRHVNDIHLRGKCDFQDIYPIDPTTTKSCDNPRNTTEKRRKCPGYWDPAGHDHEKNPIFCCDICIEWGAREMLDKRGGFMHAYRRSGTEKYRPWAQTPLPFWNGNPDPTLEGKFIPICPDCYFELRDQGKRHLGVDWTPEWVPIQQYDPLKDGPRMALCDCERDYFDKATQSAFCHDCTQLYLEKTVLEKITHKTKAYEDLKKMFLDGHFICGHCCKLQRNDHELGLYMCAGCQNLAMRGAMYTVVDDPNEDPTPRMKQERIRQTRSRMRSIRRSFKYLSLVSASQS